VLESVHSFTESPIGPWILTFFGLVVATSVGLIAWRGDRLRSPGSIDSPVSREGAFLANNLLFAAFCFIVLLGTVFPLLAEALNGDRLSVGGPYFNRMTTPIVLALLFLMAVAPVLPWRKASEELLRRRLFWPAATATLVVVLCVLTGLHGLAPLVVFWLGTFAAGSAVRQLVLSARRQGWRGLVGRANGGMIVHIGVVLIAVAFSASHAYGHNREFRLAPGQSARLSGHTVTYLGSSTVKSSNKTSVEARLRVDGGKTYTPAVHQFPFATQAIGSPSVKSGFHDDVYLTLVAAPEQAGGTAVIGVIIQPLIMWLWVGGAVIAVGTVLAAWPGRRRRPTAPVSAPVEVESAGPPPEPVGVVS
jgi:cytochrome c-type biogenesis protein CcmF